MLDAKAARDRVLQDATAAARESMRRGEPLRKTLAILTHAVEVLADHQVTASILVLDTDGNLRNGASPGLPDDYLEAIDRIRPDPELGTCAAAAATGEQVFTPDFNEDSRWGELRHLPQSIGYAGAWSQPLISPSGVVLGTFGTYFREKRMPTREEIAAVEALAPIAVMAIEAEEQTA